MKPRVYIEEEEDAEVYFELVQNHDNVEIIVVDSDGVPITAGHILSINEDGTITLYPDVNKMIGLQLDRKGCVIIENLSKTGYSIQ